MSDLQELIQLMISKTEVKVTKNQEERRGIVEYVGIKNTRVRLYPNYFTAVVPNEQIEVLSE